MTGFIIMNVLNNKTAKETLLRTFRNQHFEGKLKFSLIIKNTKFQTTLSGNEKIFCEHILKCIDNKNIIFLRHANRESDSDDVFFEMDNSITHSLGKDILPTKENIKTFSQFEEQNIIMFPMAEPKVFFYFEEMYEFLYMGNQVWVTGDPFDLLKNNTYKTLKKMTGEMDLCRNKIIEYAEK